MNAITVSGPRRWNSASSSSARRSTYCWSDFIVAFETIGEAGRDQAERRRQHRLVDRATHHVAAGAERAERIAVVALAAGDDVGAPGLADLDEVLAGELQRGLGAFRAGGAEIGVRQTARFAVQHDVREFLGGLAAERAGVGVGHGGGLAADGLGDAPVAMAQAGNGGAAGAVDDAGAVGEVKVDALAADGGGRCAAGAVQNAGGHRFDRAPEWRLPVHCHHHPEMSRMMCASPWRPHA